MSESFDDIQGREILNKEEKVKKIVMGLLILVFFGFVFAEEKYEITEVDIFSLKKHINSEFITVRGVSVTNTLQEMMQILGKTDADLKKINKDWWLNIEPGFKVRAVGKKKQKAKFQAIVLLKEFKGNLHGEVAHFFDFESIPDMVLHLTGCLGKPDKMDEVSFAGVELDGIIYWNGFRFTRLSNKEQLIITMELVTLEEILKEK